MLVSPEGLLAGERKQRQPHAHGLCDPFHDPCGGVARSEDSNWSWGDVSVVLVREKAAVY